MPSATGSSWLCAEGGLDGGGTGGILLELYVRGSEPGCVYCDVYTLPAVSSGGIGGAFCEHPSCSFSRPAGMKPVESLEDVCSCLQVGIIIAIYCRQVMKVSSCLGSQEFLMAKLFSLFF